MAKGKSEPPGNMNGFTHGLAAMQKRREENLTSEHEGSVRQQILDGLIESTKVGMSRYRRPREPTSFLGSIRWPTIFDWNAVVGYCHGPRRIHVNLVDSLFLDDTTTQKWQRLLTLPPNSSV